MLELTLHGPATIREGSTVDICVNITQPDSISSDLTILVILTIQTVNAIHGRDFYINMNIFFVCYYSSNW